jgi:enterobactin synthetase component F
MKLAMEFGKSDPQFIQRLSAVMLNNLKLARRYVPRRVECDLLYFQATEMTANLDGIVDRSPSAWEPFVGGIQVEELTCHHEAVLDPIPAARIAGRLEQRFSIGPGQEVAAGLGVSQQRVAMGAAGA